ncbi:MAG: Sapep family Mn(2+)-dependent dipeptidase, partial [Parasporobacterium sp.]|nr:Sapep family Mn(2+)-dependent dipeptidase [Parasporobacterium sp.]
PAGEGWNTDPFELTREGDVVYGRGVSDDKGPVIAALYAMKLLQESGMPINKRVRVIMGCNEETGSKCMAHYNEVEEPVTIGFTPDGEFPGIHGEKGMIKMTAYSKNTGIISMDGGFVSNAVCSRCRTIIPESAVEMEKLTDALKDTDLKSFGITHKDGTFVIEAEGVAAHASTPLLGINAAGCTMKALKEAGMKDDFVDYYNSHIGTECNGAGYGINIQDDYGELTMSNGIVKTENGVISCTLDSRVPVTYTPEQIKEMVLPYLEDDKGYTEINSQCESLFYPVDSELVTALYNAYVEVTGDTKTRPMVIGGGTYAKSIPGIIAFGNQFLGVDNHIHDANERMDINDFKLQVEIYLQALKNLL